MIIKDLTWTGIVAVAVAFGIGLGVMALLQSEQDDQKPWIKALVSAGYDMSTTVQLLALPDRPMLKTDSLGFRQATGAILYREVDENGEPLIAVYYLANKVILNNLPQPITPDSLAGKLPRDSTDTGDIIRR